MIKNCTNSNAIDLETLRKKATTYGSKSYVNVNLYSILNREVHHKRFYSVCRECIAEKQCLSILV